MLAVASPGSAQSTESASGNAPAVLFLEEDDAGRPGYVAIMSGFRQSLQQSLPESVAVYMENLDLARFSHADYHNQIRQWLRQKYHGKKINVVVASGPISMKLASEYRRDLWPDARIIGVGSRPQKDENPDETAHIAWLAVKLDAAGTLDAARKLMPDASRLVVVVGARSAYAGMNEYALREAEAAAARHGLAIEYLAGLTVTETSRRLSLLHNDAIVFYGSISLDASGRAFTPRDVLTDLSKASGAPSGLSETFMGYGMTGGSVLRMEQLGRELAEMTAEALTQPPGISPASRESGAYGIMFDWRELQRFGLSPSRLPTGAEIRFAPPSLWKSHRNAVLAGLTLLIAQSALIVAFMVQLRRRRKAEQKVIMQRDQLAHAGRVSSLGQLAASIAHELNQPLGAILRNAGAAELLLRKKDPDLRELSAIIADIRADDRRASSVIERMRALLTRHTLNFEALNLHELLLEAAELLKYEASQRALTLRVVTGAGLPPVHGDRVHLQQMVINLALNSMDALEAKPDGTVTIEANPDATGRMIELRVRDNGPGIHDAIRSSLFEPFQTTKPAGMGMGLAISQTIAEAHDAVLNLESSGPEGTCFCCSLHPFHVPA